MPAYTVKRGRGQAREAPDRRAPVRAPLALAERTAARTGAERVPEGARLGGVRRQASRPYGGRRPTDRLMTRRPGRKKPHQPPRPHERPQLTTCNPVPRNASGSRPLPPQQHHTAAQAIPGANAGRGVRPGNSRGTRAGGFKTLRVPRARPSWRRRVQGWPRPGKSACSKLGGGCLSSEI
jgi:hypothetical protein